MNYQFKFFIRIHSEISVENNNTEVTDHKVWKKDLRASVGDVTRTHGAELRCHLWNILMAALDSARISSFSRSFCSSHGRLAVRGYCAGFTTEEKWRLTTWQVWFCCFEAWIYRNLTAGECEATEQRVCVCMFPPLDVRLRWVITGQRSIGGGASRQD